MREYLNEGLRFSTHPILFYLIGNLCNNHGDKNLIIEFRMVKKTFLSKTFFGFYLQFISLRD